MAEITSESVADFIPESPADFARNPHESGADLCSPPTISRLENLPGPTALKRMTAAMVDLFCDV